ncbi:hypothetical protein RHGRI_023221 [Rhododendron griersonianum]|uniref:Uncharacterized protein n=1 Tax=Rhododendron griersonianum TaxID=479676 RepID=A0AAV6J9R0_9ERIC|nr:hypothetical protein RHGRI_023221 [Rhododendron griersonianum]
MVVDPLPEPLSTWPCSQSTPSRPVCRPLGRLLPRYCCHGPRTPDHPMPFTSRFTSDSRSLWIFWMVVHLVNYL